MTVEELIEKLKLHAGNNYEVFVTDGNDLTSINLYFATGKKLETLYSFSNNITVDPSKCYLVFKLKY